MWRDLSFMIEFARRMSHRRLDDGSLITPKDFVGSSWGDGFPEDFVGSSALNTFASAPHFSERAEKENLVWSATVRSRMMMILMT